MPQVKRLIVNADGLGATAAHNERVLAAHRNGILTSASLAVTGQAAAEAGATAKQSPTLGVGLHVALNGVSPVLAAFEIRSLVDDQGRLPAEPSALANARPEEILNELRAQHRRFRELVGRPPTHLDVKDHGHTQRPVFDALLTLAWETGLAVRSVTPLMRLRLRREELPTSDQFLEWPEGAGVEALLELLARLEPGVSELRCPPPRGQAGPDDAAQARLWGALTDESARKAIDSLGIDLAHYGQL